MVSNEEWKDIPGYEKLYQASTEGRIRTCEGKTTSSARFAKRVWKQRILKQKIHANTWGRKDARVHLWKDGKEKTWLVSRLVAMTWCSGYAEGLTVNHINGNPLDNRADNLEWLTSEENTRKARENGLCSDQIQVILKNDEGEYEFYSMAEASRFIGRNNGYISNCLKLNRSIKDQQGNHYTVIITA